MGKRPRREEFQASEPKTLGQWPDTAPVPDIHWREDDRYRRALDDVSIGILIEDGDGRVLEMNPFLRRILGFGPTELGTLASIADPPDAVRLNQQLARLRAGTITSFDMEVRVTAHDGRPRIFRKFGSRIPTFAGDESGVICVMVDITERKREQEALYRQKVQLSEGERLADMGSFELDLGTGEFAWSDGVYRLLGLAPRSITPSLAFLRDRLVPDDRPSFDADMASLKAGHRALTAERRVIRSDGEERTWRVRARLRRRTGAAPRVVGVVQDVTEQRTAERIKDEIVAVVSHELRTPLTTILAPLMMLERGQLDPHSETGRELIRDALESANHMTRLVRDIFDLGRLRTGNLTIKPQPLDLTAFLRTDGVSRWSRKAPSLAIAVEAEAGLAVLADADRLQQVLTNLIDNAISFSPPGGRIRVTASRRGDEVRVEVADQGPGVPPEQREKVFERFHQLAPAHNRSRGGTGLGLTIAKHIVERHGGRIWIEEAPGGGALVCFTLPASALS